MIKRPEDKQNPKDSRGLKATARTADGTQVRGDKGPLSRDGVSKLAKKVAPVEDAPEHPDAFWSLWADQQGE